MFNFLSVICGYDDNISKSTTSESKLTNEPRPQINFTEYKKMDLENINGEFYVESVYDGDTITILVPTKLHIYNMLGSDKVDLESDTNKANMIYFNKIRLRLMGIDTPEIKPRKDLPNRDEHIAKAKAAKDFLSNLILGKIITVKFLQNDKYGRPLANIYQNNICLNELMIEKGYAKKYLGGTKDSEF